MVRIISWTVMLVACAIVWWAVFYEIGKRIH